MASLFDGPSLASLSPDLLHLTSIFTLLFVMACLIRLAQHLHSKMVVQSVSSRYSSPMSSSLEGQTIVLADLPFDLLCQTAKQLILEGAARVIIAVPDSSQGSLAKAWVEGEVRSYNDWLISQGLEPRGYISKGRMLARMIVKQLDLSNIGSCKIFSQELGGEIDSIDALVIREPCGAVRRSSIDLSIIEEEKHSLLRSTYSDLEKGHVHSSSTQAVSTIIRSLTPRLHKAASRSHRCSHISLVSSRSQKQSSTRGWKSALRSRDRSSKKNQAKHFDQQRRLDDLLHQLVESSESCANDEKRPGVLSTWSPKELLAGLHFSSIDTTPSGGARELLTWHSKEEISAGHIRSVIGRQIAV